MTSLRTLPRAVLAAASLLTLSACASLPAPAEPLTAKPVASYAVGRTFEAPTGEWPIQDWWKPYGDRQLNALMEEALAASPSLAAAEARVQRANAYLGQARGAAAPSLSLNAGVQELKQSYNNGIPPAFVPRGYNDAGRLTLDFAWEVDFWGKNRAAIAAAASEARAAEAEAAQARLILTTSFAAAYTEFGHLLMLRDLAERGLALRTETSTLVQQRIRNGLDNNAQGRQAEAEPLAAKAELAALDEQIAVTRNRMAALLGAGPDRGLSIQRPIQDPKSQPLALPGNIALDLIGHRPDVAAARWRAEAAERRIHQARAAFFPNVNIVAFAGAQALGLENLFAAGSDIGQVGPALSLPIFEGGRLRAGLRGAEAGRYEAVAGYNAAVAEALRQTADAIAGKRFIVSQLADSRAALAASEDAYRLTRLRYEGGLTAYPSVLIAEQTLLARRRAVADLETRAIVLDVTLIRALGGGYASS